MSAEIVGDMEFAVDIVDRQPVSTGQFRLAYVAGFQAGRIAQSDQIAHAAITSCCRR